MTYKITARDGNVIYTLFEGPLDLTKEFLPDQYYNLTDTQVLDMIIKYGRAEITEHKGYRSVEFHNGYD